VRRILYCIVDRKYEYRLQVAVQSLQSSNPASKSWRVYRRHTLKITGLISLWEQFMVWLCGNKGHNQPYPTVQYSLIPLRLRDEVTVRFTNSCLTGASENWSWVYIGLDALTSRVDREIWPQYSQCLYSVTSSWRWKRWSSPKRLQTSPPQHGVFIQEWKQVSNIRNCSVAFLTIRHCSNGGGLFV
jgi:hypothetical protein